MIQDNDESRLEYVENAFSRLKEDGRVEEYWSRMAQKRGWDST